MITYERGLDDDIVGITAWVRARCFEAGYAADSLHREVHPGGLLADPGEIRLRWVSDVRLFDEPA